MPVMASTAQPDLQSPDPLQQGAAMQHGPWRRRAGLSSALAGIEAFLAGSRFDRAPWLAVAFGAGIGAWFGLSGPMQWIALLLACAAAMLASLAFLRADGAFPFLRQALLAVPLMLAAGTGAVWSKSALVGREPIARPVVATFEAHVLSRVERSAEDRVRLVAMVREPASGRPIKVRLGLPLAQDRPGVQAGARLRLKARLMPPAPPMLPGGYDFARTAWFQGLSATGTVIGPVEIVRPAKGRALLAETRADLSSHVRERLDGSAGAIAAALASGDRGAIAEDDDQAMRDSGLAHLLSISGLHVTALVGAAYLLALRLLALWPWLALRVRLPLVAAAVAAGAGIGYTLLTGAEVPTVRSCVAAVLVLLALALGRQPLSMRMLSVAAFFVMVFWPESIIGPSFQMSFAAVISIIALHGSAPVQAFLAPREESWIRRGGRYFAMLLLTGLVIELALMPIGLFHFHRSGIYGALANLVAIPLTTSVVMPLIALALALDVVGAGFPAWWLAGKSLDLMIAMAHWVSAQPGAVKTLPSMGAGRLVLFMAGGLWLALWQGRVRYLGLVPMIIGAASLALLRPPDLLVSNDGRHVAITRGSGELLMLRGAREGYARDNLTELAGGQRQVLAMAEAPGARCNQDFCAIDLERGGRVWRLLLSRGRDFVPVPALAAACERADIVISDRRLPRACRPRWLRADRALLSRTGGLTIDLAHGTVTSVAQTQGDHGWWRGGESQRGGERQRGSEPSKGGEKQRAEPPQPGPPAPGTRALPPAP